MKESFFSKFTSSITVGNLCQRIKWLIQLRWIAGFFVVTSVLAGKAFFEIENVALPLMLGGFIIFYNAVFARIRHAMKSSREETDRAKNVRLAIINIQILVDLVVLAALIYVTGGLANPFLFFFLFHMVIASITLSKKNAFFWAGFTIVLETLLVYLEHFKYIPANKFFPFYPEGLVGNHEYIILLLTAFSITVLITVYFATSIVRPIRKRQLDLNDLQEDLQRQRDQLEMKNKELSEMDRSKTDFLYRVEHELKAPIGALSGLLSVVTRGYSSVTDEKKKELLFRAERRVIVMRQLVKDLLSLSLVNQRGFQLERQPLQLAELVKTILDDLSTYSERKKIPIKADIASSLPEISADRNAMEEVIRNLVHNGVKYSFEGEVKVSLKQDGRWLVFRVEDSGIGISEEDLGNIFTEFYRTANAKAFEEGTGLGLSLVKRLVEQHEGVIEASSVLNQGTTFTVKLPTGPPACEEEACT